MRSKKTSFASSLSNALSGLVHLLRSERNFQIEVAALLLNLVLIVVLEVPLLKTLMILSVCLLVLFAETLNTAVEKLCDALHPSHHPTIGLVKDLCAGAVLLCAALALIVGVVVYYPYVVALLLR